MKQITCIVDDETHRFIEAEAKANRRTNGNELLAMAFPKAAPPSAKIGKLLTRKAAKKGLA